MKPAALPALHTITDYEEAIALLRRWSSAERSKSSKKLLLESEDLLRRVSMPYAKRVRYEERVW